MCVSKQVNKIIAGFVDPDGGNAVRVFFVPAAAGG